MGRDYYQEQLESESNNNTSQSKDINGNILNNGDNVVAAKDLKVKGMSKTIKRGDKFKIRLTDDPTEVECKVGKSTIVLKTQYFKKI